MADPVDLFGQLYVMQEKKTRKEATTVRYSKFFSGDSFLKKYIKKRGDLLKRVLPSHIFIFIFIYFFKNFFFLK